MEKIDGNARYCVVTRYVTALRYSRYPIVLVAKEETATALELEQKRLILSSGQGEINHGNRKYA